MPCQRIEPSRGRRILSVVLGTLAIAVGLATASPGPMAQEAVRQPAPSETASERGRLLDAVSATISGSFFDVDRLKAVDWPARVEAARPKVTGAATTVEAAGIINDLLGELRTSHTALFTPDDVGYYLVMDAIRIGRGIPQLIEQQFWGNAPYYASIGIFTREIDGRHFIDGVLEGSPAAAAGLRYGDEVVAVDGGRYHPVASLRGKIGQSVEIAVRRTADGEPVKIRVTPAAMVPSIAFASAAYASARVIEHQGKRIGYFRVWGSKDSTSFKMALSRLVMGDLPDEHSSWLRRQEDRLVDRPVDGLIVDMRGKVGGSANTYREYLAALGERFAPKADFKFRMRREGGDRSDGRSAARFRGRVVLLTDASTRSAAELFAYAFRRQEMGLIIGTTTAGAVSAGSTFAMPGGNLLYVAVGGITADGEPLEGRGVAPDIAVERPLPYAQGSDPVLERALAEIVEMPAVKGAPPDR